MPTLTDDEHDVRLVLDDGDLWGGVQLARSIQEAVLRDTTGISTKSGEAQPGAPRFTSGTRVSESMIRMYSPLRVATRESRAKFTRSSDSHPDVAAGPSLQILTR